MWVNNQNNNHHEHKENHPVAAQNKKAVVRLSQQLHNGPYKIEYVYFRPLFFSIGSAAGACPRNFAYMSASTSVLPRERIISRNF